MLVFEFDALVIGGKLVFMIFGSSLTSIMDAKKEHYPFQYCL
jgi:hypothetical protein